jgi:hypothetical protein
VAALAIAAAIVATLEDAAKVFLEADAGFFGGTGGIGIERLEKILYFLPHLRIRQNGLT